MSENKQRLAKPDLALGVPPWMAGRSPGVWGRCPAAKERPRTGRGQDAKVIIRYNDLTLKKNEKTSHFFKRTP